MEREPNLPTTDALGRQIWDKNYFAERAAVRQYEDNVTFDDDLEGGKKKKQRKEPPPPSERRPLEQRTETVPLEAEIGKAKIISTHTPKQAQGGFWCDVCECLIKDSQAYLDHINGKRHNRLLGMSMRVERVGVDKIKSRLQQVKQEKEKAKERQELMDSLPGVDFRIKELTEAEKQRKKEKKEKKKRKKMQKEGLDSDHDDKTPAAIAERLRKMFASAAQGPGVSSESAYP